MRDYFKPGSLVVLSYPRHHHSIPFKGELVKLLGEPTVIHINNSPVTLQFYDRPRNNMEQIPCYDSIHAFTVPKDLISILKRLGVNNVEGLYESKPEN